MVPKATSPPRPPKELISNDSLEEGSYFETTAPQIAHAIPIVFKNVNFSIPNEIEIIVATAGIQGWKML
jgi:hypothetical protein